MKFNITRTHYYGNWKGDECIDANPDNNDQTFTEVYNLKSIEIAKMMIPKIFFNEKEISGCELPLEPTEEFENMVRFYVNHPIKDHINMDIIEIRKGIERPSKTGQWLDFLPFKYESEELEE